MRLSRIHVFEYSGPTPGARAGARDTTERRGLLLQIVTPDGHIGQGEASPLPGYSRETFEQCARALSTLDWSSLPEPGSSNEETLRDLADRLFGVPCAARFAAETAWFDLLGQRLSAPVCSLLDPGASLAGAPVSLSAYVGSAKDESVVQRAREGLDQGFRTLKVKVEGPLLGAQLDVLGRVRNVIGDAALRLDANGSLEPRTAEAELSRLVPLAPEFIEEPVPPEALGTFASPPITIALDESLRDHAAEFMARASELHCVALVLKPMFLGLSTCLRLALDARERGIDVTVSHLFDGPVALAASAHLAFAVASRTRASGLARHAGLAAWPEVELPMMNGARIIAPSRPGLGLAPLPHP